LTVPLQQLKSNGRRLGNPINLPHAQTLGRVTQAERASARAIEIAPVIEEIRASGLKTLDEIAVALNRRGYKTARGKPWQKTTVSRAIARARSAVE
jgi:hypothetical protein